MSTKNESSGVEVITAQPGTEAYERQFQHQSTAAIQRIARMPLTRTICGVLSILYIVIVIFSTIVVIQSQLRDGVDFLEIIAQAGCLWFFGWLITVQGRIALHGEFT